MRNERHHRAAIAPAVLALAALAVLGPAATHAVAQVFEVQAGASSLYDAAGGSVRMHAEGAEAWLGLAGVDPLRVGFGASTRYRGAGLTFGDAVVPFHLPTDALKAGQSLVARGVGVGYEDRDVRVAAFGGATANATSYPYTFWAEGDRPVGLVFLESKVSSSVRLSSRSLYSDGMTTILALDWKPGLGYGGAIAGGSGADEGYAAASAWYERGRLTARGGYVVAGDGFRRVITPQPGAAELIGPSLELGFRVRPELTLGASHTETVQPDPGPRADRKGTVNQWLASGRFLGVGLGAAYFRSRSGIAGSDGVSLSFERAVPQVEWLHLNGSWLYSDPLSGVAFRMLVAGLRETISPRLDLIQLATHSGDNTTVSFGGTFTSSAFTVGAEYQTVYVPFNEEKPFQQALMLTVRLQGPGGVKAEVGSYIDPTGRVRYTAQGSQFVYKGASAAPKVPEFGIPDNVIRGTVQDDAGAAISGAALQIGDELVLTDSQGAFFVRMKKAKDYPIVILYDEFLGPVRYEALYVPTQAAAQPEAHAASVSIVLRRATN